MMELLFSILVAIQVAFYFPSASATTNVFSLNRFIKEIQPVYSLNIDNKKIPLFSIRGGNSSLRKKSPLRTNMKLAYLYGGFITIISTISAVLWKSFGRNVGVAFAAANFLKLLIDLAVSALFDPSWFAKSQGGLDAKVHDPELFVLTQEVAQCSKIPEIKKVWLIPSEEVNAYAIGFNQHCSNVAVTTALRKILSPKELKAVVGHECGHIKNHDCSYSTHLLTMVTGFSFISDTGSEVLRAVDSYQRQVKMIEASQKENKKGMGDVRNNPSTTRTQPQPESDSYVTSVVFDLMGKNKSCKEAAFCELAGMVLCILGSAFQLVSLIVMKSVSRANEFNADSHGAKVAGAPYMISSLQKIEQSAARRSKGEATFDGLANAGLYSSLYIHRPIRKSLYWVPSFISNVLATVESLFSTHPPTSDRIEALTVSITSKPK